MGVERAKPEATDFKQKDPSKKKKKKKVDLLDLLIPAPKYDPNDPD